ncbi:MAG TPA: MFS transporter [Thermoplasmata archaeon]|nr:MFS transporter [Thermoplasmata archaeon]
MPATPVPSPTAATSLSRTERATILLTTLGTVMVAVDSTIVILALPTMKRDLGAPLETVIWTILIYLLIAAALTTQAGRVGDLWGRGRVYNAGFAVFTVGSVLCGFSPTASILIASRVVQAVGAAVMFANAGALIAHVFPPQRRGRAFGFMTFGWSVGAILGILLGGVITTTIGWRYIFFINLPIGVVAVVLGYLTLPRTPGRKVRFDVPGFVTFSAGLAAICYGAIEIASYGVAGAYVGYLALGFALVAAFALIELRTAEPMLDLRQLTDRLLGFSLVAGLLQSVGYLSVIFLLTLYLQGIRALSPLDASVLLIPGYLVGAVAGPTMGRFVDRFGPRGIATLGIGLMMAAVLAYATLTTTSWLGWIPMISVVSGVGTGMFFPANSTAIMSRATPATFGSLSGLRGTLMNMGTLLSFVLTLSIAAASVSRGVAYAIFIGAAATPSIANAFLGGIHAALYGSAGILAVAALLSWSRGHSTAPVAAPAPTPALARDEP